MTQAEKSWKEENQSEYLYKILARMESGSPREVLFSKLSEEAKKQAAIWADLIRKSGGLPPQIYRPNLRVKIVVGLLRIFGPKPLRMILAAMKVRGMSVYSEGGGIHPIPSTIEEVGRRHKGFGKGGNLRAAVFGISDGLVSNASLIFGVVGGVGGSASDGTLILLSGIAGLLAGAFSMGAGEYLSVKSQREMFEYQIHLEEEELKEYPDAEAAELALIYQAKGLSQGEAKELADKLIADPNRALDTLAREELGLNPEGLGSPWGAAFSSFLSFSTGAFIPLSAFFFSKGSLSLGVSIVLTGTTLFFVGMTLSLFTGKNGILGGLRMLLIGGAAGTATFLIGKILGVSLNSF